MKVEIGDSTGCPVPQFIIKAETEQDRAILKSFVSLPKYAKDSWKFSLHGYTLENGDIWSFNFGWSREDNITGKEGPK